MIKWFSRATRRECLALTGDLIPFSPLAIIPPEEHAEGIYLGVDEWGRDVYVDISRLPSFHGLITGDTGSGKSTLARHIVLEAYDHGINTWIIDPHGEKEYFKLVKSLGGTVLDMTVDKINIFQHIGYNREDYSDILSTIFQIVLNLSETQRMLVKKAILNTLEDDSIEEAITVLKGEAEIDPFMKEVYGKVAPLLRRMNGALDIREFLEKPLDIAFRSPYSGVVVRKDYLEIIMLTLLLQIDGLMRSRGICHKPELLIVVDEAHNIFELTPRKNFLVDLYRETRKFGYALLSISQLPRSIPSEVLQLAGYGIFLSGGKGYIEELESIAYLSSDDRDWLLYNVRGNAILVRKGDPRPRRIRLKLRKDILNMLNKY